MTELPLKDRNLRFVVLKAIVDAGATELGNLRDEHLPALLAAYRSTEASSFKVRAPGTNGAPGPVVATVSLSVPKPKMEIHDQEEFLDWVQATHPDLVDVELIPAMPEHTIVVPATEERTERRLDPKAWATLVKHFDQAEEGGIVDTATGAMVDGIVVNPGGDPKSFAVKYEAGAADQLLASYRAGRLDEVVAGTSLPEVASRVVVERRLQVAAPSVMGEGGMVMPPAAALDLDPRDEDGPGEFWADRGHDERPGHLPDLVKASDPERTETATGGWCAPSDSGLQPVGQHEYSLRSHFPPAGAPHALTECADRGCPHPAAVAEAALTAPEPDFDPGDWGAPSHAADPWG